MWLALVIAALCMFSAFGLLGWLWWRDHRRRRRHPDVLQAVRQRLFRIAGHLPDRRDVAHVEFPAIEASATIEALLIQGWPTAALVAAGDAVRQSPHDGRGYLHLARALLYCDDADNAARALARARSLGEVGPASQYLDARLRWHRVGRDEDRGAKRRAMDVLDILLDALERDPAFGEAAYHAAIVAHALGLEREASQIINKIEPLLEASPELKSYRKSLPRFEN